MAGGNQSLMGLAPSPAPNKGDISWPSTDGNETPLSWLQRHIPTAVIPIAIVGGVVLCCLCGCILMLLRRAAEARRLKKEREQRAMAPMGYGMPADGFIISPGWR